MSPRAGTLSFVTFAFFGLAVADIAVDTRHHARDLHKRAEVDCGTWVMQCGGTRGGDGVSIEDICNNACFYQKWSIPGGGEYVATYRKDVNNDRNRVHSGCQIDGKSVCKVMPFSQKMADGFNLNDPTCEEFPMADWTQPDFDSNKTPRNALRCVERRQNTAAGAQWLSFRQGKGDHPKRTCQGDMSDDNTDYKFKIEMNLENTDAARLPYCNHDSDNLPTNADPGEFYMHTLSLPNGANHFPYKETDNVYTTAAYWAAEGFVADNVWQCRLELTRTAGDSYSAAFYDDTKAEPEEIASKAQGLNNDGDFMDLVPTDDKWEGYPTLRIIRTGEMGQGGTKGSKVKFISKHSADGNNPFLDFSFDTESEGWDARFKQKDGSEKGLYCDVPNIDDSGENGPRQQITCWYPCDYL